MDMNTDYPGNDIKSFQSSGEEECINRCRETPNCKAFLIAHEDFRVNQPKNYCWLKNVRNVATHAKNMSNIAGANLDCFIGLFSGICGNRILHLRFSKVIC